MATKNEITGDTIATRSVSQDYRSGWDAIFAKAGQSCEKNPDLSRNSTQAPSEQQNQTGQESDQLPPAQYHLDSL